MFNLLNMGSTDLTARARIRDSALEMFAEKGFHKATVREIAAGAEVSPGLVVHHFGSKEGLRAACDEHVLAYWRAAKSDAFAGMAFPRTDTTTRSPDFLRVWGYFKRVLATSDDVAAEFFDRVTDDVAGFLDLGERAGTVRPTPDPEARATITTAMALGLMVYEPFVARRLGGETLLDPQVLERYTAFTMDAFTHGLITADLTEQGEGGSALQPHGSAADPHHRSSQGEEGS